MSCHCVRQMGAHMWTLLIVQMPSTYNCKRILGHRLDSHLVAILVFGVEFEVSFFAESLAADQLVCEDFEVSEHFDFVFVVLSHCHYGC